MAVCERPREERGPIQDHSAQHQPSLYGEPSLPSQAALLFIPPGIENTLADDPYERNPRCSPTGRAIESKFPWMPACELEAGLESAHLNYVGAGKLKTGADVLQRARRAKLGVASTAAPLSAERSLPQFLKDVSERAWQQGKSGPQRDLADWEALAAIGERDIHPALKHIAIDIAQATPGVSRPSLHWIRVSDGRDFLVTAQYRVDPLQGSSVMLRLFDPAGKQVLSQMERALPRNEADAAREVRTSLEGAKETLERLIAHSRATQVGRSGLRGRAERYFPEQQDIDAFSATH